MPERTPETSISIRPPEYEDAEAMLKIFLATKHDAVPVYYEHEEAQLRRHRKFGKGLDVFHRIIADTIRDPQRFCTRIAELDGIPAGYINAEAVPGKTITELGGVMVAEAGKGIGRALMARERMWMQDVGRPVHVKVADSNQRSSIFFKRQGFIRIDTVVHVQRLYSDTIGGSSHNRVITPILLNVLELSLDKLMNNEDQENDDPMMNRPDVRLAPWPDSTWSALFDPSLEDRIYSR